ncbi:MAG: glycosyltransferase [Gemmatimonadales bacterium]
MWREAEGAPGLEVYTPDAWLPRLGRLAWAARRLDRVRLGWARRRLLARGVRRVVFSVWRPEFVQMLDARGRDIVLYHVNDEYSFRVDSPPASALERELLARADISYFSSRSLLELKGSLGGRASFLPNGVDYRAFSTPCPEPADLASVPRPRIGYTGWVKKQLDWDLVESLARRRPDLHFTFVGDVSPHPGLIQRIAPIRALRNVHFLGGKSTAELTAYPQHFDVCALPYLVDGYTRFIYPLKLHEYLASGCPVIGSPLPALAEFQEFVAISNGPEEWSATIDRLLGPDARSAAVREARRAVARAHDWDGLAARIAEDILVLARQD